MQWYLRGCQHAWRKVEKKKGTRFPQKPSHFYFCSGLLWLWHDSCSLAESICSLLLLPQPAFVCQFGLNLSPIVPADCSVRPSFFYKGWLGLKEPAFNIVLLYLTANIQTEGAANMQQRFLVLFYFIVCFCSRTLVYPEKCFLTWVKLWVISSMRSWQLLEWCLLGFSRLPGPEKLVVRYMKCTTGQCKRWYLWCSHLWSYFFPNTCLFLYSLIRNWFFFYMLYHSYNNDLWFFFSP